MVYSIRYIVSAIWYMVYSTWYIVYGIWCMVYGTWYIVCGTWYIVYGMQYMVSSATVHFQESRATLRLGIGFHIGILLQSLYNFDFLQVLGVGQIFPGAQSFQNP